MVHVVLWKDENERRVEVPQDLSAALDASLQAKALFSSLSYSHQKQYSDWIVDAKRPETKAMRVEKTLAMLSEGIKRR